MTIGSRQVQWFAVYEFVASLLAGITSRPAAGTPAWCALADDDPRKLASVLEGGVHWALRIDAEQTSQAQLSQDLSTDADWIGAVAEGVRNHPQHRIRRAS